MRVEHFHTVGLAEVTRMNRAPTPGSASAGPRSLRSTARRPGTASMLGRSSMADPGHERQIAFDPASREESVDDALMAWHRVTREPTAIHTGWINARTWTPYGLRNAFHAACIVQDPIRSASDDCLLFVRLVVDSFDRW